MIKTLYGSRIVFLGSLLLFRAILDLSYVAFVHDQFEYTGFGLNPTLIGYCVSWVVYIWCASILCSRLDNASDFIFLTIVLSLIGPLTSYYALNDVDISPLLHTVMAFLIVRAISRIKFRDLALPMIRNGGVFAIVMSVLFSVYLLAWYVVSGAVSNFNLNLLEVYEYRDLSRELANIGVLAYLNHWTYSVFNLFCVAFFLHRKKYTIVLVFLLLQVFFFGVSTHKSVLFYPALIIFFYIYLRRTDRLVVVPLFFTVIVFGCLMHYIITSDILYASLFIRRVHFVPASLTYDYFGFFSENVNTYWSNSVLSSVVEYPYYIRVAEVIGLYNGRGSSANNGFVSSGYAHAGTWGVIIYSVIFGIIVRAIDALCRNGIPIWLALSITFIPLRSAILSSDLLTTLMTHGLGVSLLLLFLARGGYMVPQLRSLNFSRSSFVPT